MGGLEQPASSPRKIIEKRDLIDLRPLGAILSKQSHPEQSPAQGKGCGPHCSLPGCSGLRDQEYPFHKGNGLVKGPWVFHKNQGWSQVTPAGQLG